MKKILLLLLISLNISSFALAEDKSPFDKSPLALFNKAVERDDDLLLARSNLRCASLYQLLAELFKRDFPEGDFSSFSSAADDLLSVGAQINRNISMERGITEDKINEIDERTLGELQQYMSIYSNWLTENYTKQGEYFGSSVSAQNEIEECKLVVELIRSFQ